MSGLSLRLGPGSKAPFSLLILSAVLEQPFPAVAIDAGLAKDEVELVGVDAAALLRSDIALSRYVARTSALAPMLLGSDADAVVSAQIANWVDFAVTVAHGVVALGDAIDRIDSHMQLRTFLVGHNLTLAEIAVFGALNKLDALAAAEKDAKAAFPHFSRWIKHVRSFAAFAKTIALGARAVDKAAKESEPKKGDGKKGDGAAAEDKSEGSGPNIDFPFAEMGKVCTRFPPEPSGYLHIGHCKAALLNNYFARKYKGKLIIRFDDTNPSNESQEFVDAILQDLATLGIKGDMLTYTSDSFPICEQQCERLIKEGKAYADSTPVEQMRKERGEGIESKYRSNTVEENLRLWKEMLAGTPEGLKTCIRARMDMQDTNKCMRDAVLYRCNLTPHHRTGTKYKAYPSYDFSCPLIDSIEGVTHAMRSNEYSARIPQYKWMLRAMGLRDVHLYEFSRLNLYKCVLSKRKLQWFVDTGRVEGWHDPRFPTVRGIMRRGLTVEALTQFALEQGASSNANFMDWDKIWALNKKVIDPKAPRFVAISNEHVVPFNLVSGGAPAAVEFVTRPAHPKNAAVGTKSIALGNKLLVEQADAITFKDGEEITLMDWGNAIVRKIHKDANGVVTSIDGELHLAGDFKSTEKKITWIANCQETVPVNLTEFDYLINKNKIEPEDDFNDYLTETTRYDTPATGDMNFRAVNKGDILQIPRRGFYVCDEPYVPATATAAARPAQLFFIPDGKVGAISNLGVKVKVTSGATESAKSIERKARTEKKEQIPEDDDKEEDY